jgi:uncharacterized protein (DUF1330 family)
MTVYVIVTVTLHDKAWMKEYNATVPAIVRSYGGEYLAIGKRVVPVEGVEAVPDRVAILTYPSIEALMACMDSPEYAPYKASRMGPAKTEIIAFEAV